MSNVESITYEELMRECNFDNSIDFKKTVRSRKDLPQISSSRSIPHKEAEQIVKALTGHGIDWMKYKSSRRDEDDEGLLAWSDSGQISSSIDKWFLEIDTDAIAQAGTQLVALACEGGFLAGRDRPAFVLTFDKGLNVIIGDRGSGKSTVLSLLGAVSDSVGEETQILVKHLLSILHPETESDENEKASLNRRIYQTLRHYSINEYGIFFSKNGRMYCYYVNRKEKRYSMLEKSKNGWQYETQERAFMQIPLLFFSQGEVIRIAEDREQNSYLNNILDAIYPDLFQKRTALFQSVRSILRQRRAYRHFNLKFKTRHIGLFLQERERELYRIQREIDRGQFGYASERQIYDYLARCENYYQRHPEKSWKATRITDYFEDADPDTPYYLYVNRIRNFLFEKMSKIRELRPTPADSGAGVIVEPAPVEENPAPEFEVLTDEEEESQLPPILEEDLESIEVEDEGDVVYSQAQSNMTKDVSLFLKAVEPSPRVWVSKELLNIANEVVDYLRKRLQVLSSWHKIYKYSRLRYEDTLKSLAKDYSKLLEKKSILIKSQAEKCAEMTGILKKDDLSINITTARVQQTLEEGQAKIRLLQELGHRFKQVTGASPAIKLPELRNAQLEYDNTIRSLMNDLELLEEQIQSEVLEFFTFPIKIELLQGNIFRDFQYLSFGQKSGIILKMVLSTTNKSIIVIDQPEDNLDAFSIIKIIAPTLKNLHENDGRQIIVVTHNSNLVMQAPPDRLIALESHGNNGKIKFTGPPVGKQAVGEIFDILEGGVPTFTQKIKTYENFVGMVKKVEDWDIQLIESSFRQRTIDGLRNYLQPIVTDRSMLDFLRHQLKQWDPNEFSQHIGEFIKRLENMAESPKTSNDDLFDMLTTLAQELDHHITQFTISIDHIRMMDTQPKIGIVRLYDLLKKKQEDVYIQKLRRSRQITINIDAGIENIDILADVNHLDLVFTNLIENSLRATEKVVNRNRKQKNEYVETISVVLESVDDKHVRLLYSDNGCGVAEEILKQLYIEPCSTKEGKEGHGLGGIIIRKLLEINKGSIAIIESRTAQPNSGITQRILLTKSLPTELLS